jgi:soluble lytic murein transglycosylase-like protein
MKEPLFVSNLGRNPEFSKLKETTAKDVVQIIKKAADEFGVDPSLMVDIAAAESSLDPNKPSSKSSAEGLYQFIDNSWKQMMRELGLPEDTPKTNPAANARAAALALSKGRLRWWQASRWNWGRFYDKKELEKYEV